MIVPKVLVMLPISFVTCEPVDCVPTGPLLIASPLDWTSMPFGNLARNGTRTPPSVVNALYNLLGAVAAWAHRGPYQMKLLPRPRFSSELS